MHAKDRTLLASLSFADPDKKNVRHDLACQYVAQPKVADKLVKMFVKQETTPFGQYGAGILVEPGEKAFLSDRRTWRFTQTSSAEIAKAQSAALEVPISKGDGQYRTTIGFVDAHIPFTVVRLTKEEHLLEWRMLRDPPAHGHVAPYNAALVGNQISDPAGPTPSERVDSFLGDLFVEVKIAKESLGNMLRQINMYNEYRPFLCGRVHSTYDNQCDNRRGHGCMSRTVWVLVTDFPLSSADVETLTGAGIRHVTLGADFEAFIKDMESAPASTSISI